MRTSIENQQKILDFIRKEIEDKGYPPSVREICAAVGLKSTSTVHAHLNNLEKRGLIRRERSSEDHRQVHILLTREGERVYAAAHQELLALPQGLIDRLGAEKMSMFADLMHTVAENFQEMLEERNQTEQEKEDSQKVISF